MKLLRDIKRSLHGLRLFMVFLVGRVPNHQFRLFCYRNLFGMTIGRNSTVHWRAVFFAPEGVSIGSNCIVGNDVFLDGRMGISLGENVNIGGHAQIFTLEHDPNSPDFGVKGGEVIIGDRAYIASRSTILPGVAIGRGAVVAAGAVVTKDVPDFSIVGGVPARVIGKRSEELDYRLDYHLPFQ